jgi:hypothetical protein
MGSPGAELDTANFLGSLLKLQGQLQEYRGVHKYHLGQRDLTALTILDLSAELLPIPAIAETGSRPREMQFDRFLKLPKVLQLDESALLPETSIHSHSWST